MCTAENESGGGENAGSFIRFFYPVDKTAGPIDESKYCFWMPREEYTTGASEIYETSRLVVVTILLLDRW